MNFELLISYEQIAAQLAKFAKQINEDYQDRDLTIIMVMKGAICFASDLIRRLEPSCSLEFIHCKSYRDNKQGELQITGLDEIDITHKDVLLVDDIFDTGKTITEIVRQLMDKRPASLRSIVLLSRNTERTVYYKPDYSLFEINDDAFVLGYGLDYNERYRGLPGIYCVRP